MKHYRKTLGMIAWIADGLGLRNSTDWHKLGSREKAHWNRIAKAVQTTVVRRRQEKVEKYFGLQERAAISKFAKGLNSGKRDA